MLRRGEVKRASAGSRDDLKPGGKLILDAKGKVAAPSIADRSHYQYTTRFLASVTRLILAIR